MLLYVFGLKEALDTVGSSNTDTKTLLRNTIITVAHKAYLDRHFAALHGEMAQQAELLPIFRQIVDNLGPFAV